MKIGDNVQLKYPFTIAGYRPDYQVFDINIRVDKGQFEIDTIPIYISRLGIYYKMFKHPTQIKEITFLDKEKEIVEKGGKAYKLRLDKDFQLNGKYYLIGNDIEHFTAPQFTEDEKNTMLNSCVGNTYNGSIISGPVIAIYIQSKRTSAARIVRSLSETIILDKLYNIIPYAVIKDTVTLTEISIKASLLEHV